MNTISKKALLDLYASLISLCQSKYRNSTEVNQVNECIGIYEIAQLAVEMHYVYSRSVP